MNLFTNCKSCRKENFIKSSASTRPDLEMEKGEEFNIQCTECLVTNKVHVNDVSATENNNVIIAGVLLSIIITIFLWSFLGAIGTISVTIPILIWQAQSSSVNAFNSYMITRSK